MSATFEVKRGDALVPVLAMTLLEDGAPVDLSAATGGVKFFFRKGGVVLTRVATIDSPATDGVVRYAFLATDWGNLVDEKFAPGSYQFEAQVTFSGGGVATFPTSGYNTVVVNKDLAD